MTKSADTKSIKNLTNWELLIIFIGFLSVVTLIVSVWAAYHKDSFYPWGLVAYGGPWSGPVSGGPWNIPTRYPIRGWGWDIRGYPAPYPIDYGLYGYPGGQPAYPAPEPDGSISSSASSNDKATNQAPFGIEMTANSTTTKPSTTITSSSANNKAAQNKERVAERTADELYEKESKWWPDWVSWPWIPYFNYGLHYDVNGKLKPANNDSIVANHTWSWW
jgi:hypothetical protein